MLDGLAVSQSLSQSRKTTTFRSPTCKTQEAFPNVSVGSIRGPLQFECERFIAHSGALQEAVDPHLIEWIDAVLLHCSDCAVDKTVDTLADLSEFVLRFSAAIRTVSKNAVAPFVVEIFIMLAMERSAVSRPWTRIGFCPTV